MSSSDNEQNTDVPEDAEAQQLAGQIDIALTRYINLAAKFSEVSKGKAIPAQYSYLPESMGKSSTDLEQRHKDLHQKDGSNLDSVKKGARVYVGAFENMLSLLEEAIVVLENQSVDNTVIDLSKETASA